MIEIGLGEVPCQRDWSPELPIDRLGEAQGGNSLCNPPNVGDHGLASGLVVRRAARLYSLSAAERNTSFTAACRNTRQYSRGPAPNRLSAQAVNLDKPRSSGNGSFDSRKRSLSKCASIGSRPGEWR